MKNLTLLLALLFITLNTQAQNYRAIYKANNFARMAVPLSPKDTFYLPFSLRATVEILVNAEYITINEMKPIIESKEGVESDWSVDTIFIDVKNKIGCSKKKGAKPYYMETLDLVKKKEKRDDNCTHYHIKQYSSIKVITCKDIPKEINPRIFSKNLHGIKSMKGGTADMSYDIELVSFEATNTEVNHKEFFAKFKKSDIQKSPKLIQPPFVATDFTIQK